MFVLLFSFVIVCGLLEWRRTCADFSIVCVYKFCSWRCKYQEGKAGIPLAGLTPPPHVPVPVPGHGFLMSFLVVSFTCSMS